MKKQLNIMVLSAFVSVLMVAGQVRAADLAGASGILAEMAVMVVQAKANLALAASTGDVDAIADAVKRADAVDAALAEAQEAFAALERAVAGKDEAAAAAKAADLEVARQKAFDALNGAVPEASPQSEHTKWVKEQENTGGSPGDAYDPPDMGPLWGPQGQQNSSGELDATPE